MKLVDGWGKCAPGRGYSMSKGPETGVWAPCLWNRKEAGMAGAEGVVGQRAG